MKISIETVMRRELELRKEQSEIMNELHFWQSQPQLAREAIQRFVHPDMYPSAIKWLDSVRFDRRL